MNIEKAKIYGVDKVGSSTPSALTRTDDAVGLSYTVGTTDIVSDFDRCYPWSDMQEVTDASGNVFIKIPKFYSKITKNSDGTYKHQISGIRYEGFSTLFVDGAGNELDYVLVGKYEGSGSSARVYSKSGATVLVNITCDNFRTGCKANGAGYQQYDFLIDLIIKELWLIEMKTTNSQSVMYGYANGNSAAVATGRTDAVKTRRGRKSATPTANTLASIAVLRICGVILTLGATVYLSRPKKFTFAPTPRLIPRAKQRRRTFIKATARRAMTTLKRSNRSDAILLYSTQRKSAVAQQPTFATSRTSAALSLRLAGIGTTRRTRVCGIGTVITIRRTRTRISGVAFNLVIS